MREARARGEPGQRRRVSRMLLLKVSNMPVKATNNKLFLLTIRPLIYARLKSYSSLTQTANAISDDFEVSIFLTELSSRHSVLTKQKIFRDKARIQSNSGRLTNWLTSGTSDQPVLVNEDSTHPIVIRDEEDEEVINLADIPEADSLREPSRRSARKTRRAESSGADGTDDESDNSALFVPGRTPKRSKIDSGPARVDDNENEDVVQDDKKKLGLNTSYDGFSIYGRILCLVVKRRGARTSGGVGAPASSQQMLENWVSTQAAADQVDDDEDVG
jgi:hypothetical protein